MRTQFKGTINGKEFDNVQDYNAEMQRLIAAGESINAHADTQTIETPANDTSFLFPGFAQCESIGKLTEEFIDVALGFEPDKFAAQVNDLLHDRILPTIARLSKEDLDNYGELVGGIRKYLADLAQDSDLRAEQTVRRLEAIEAELQELNTQSNKEADRKAVIDFVASLYENIDKAISTQGNVAQVPQDIPGHTDPAGEPGQEGCAHQKECTQGIANPGEDYINRIRTKARQLFGI